MKFKHLTYTDRLIIEKLYKKDTSVKEIAEYLNVHVSTLYREIKRGYYDRLKSDYTYVKDYSAEIAQRDYDLKAELKGAPLKIAKNHKLAQYIENRIIEDKYSPAAVLAELKHKNIPAVSLVTLYSYIDKGIFLRLTNKDLPEKSLRKRPYNKVQQKAKRPPAGLSIEQRPKHVYKREEFGHWEMDTLIGKAKGKGQALLVLSERKTRFEIILKLKDKTTKSVIKALDGLEKRYDYPSVFKTITCDNGSEFADACRMAHDRHGNIRTTIYYCHPYTSSERGTNENINRMIRRHFPKGSDFSKLTAKDCARVQDWLNNYPRRVLGYQTAQHAFNLSC